MARKLLSACGIVFLSLFCLLSCGLEAFYYIEFIHDEYVAMSDVTRASIRLPSRESEGNGYSPPSDYFDNFIIFYRIYISGDNPVGTILTSDLRNTINPTLNSDFNGILSTTDKTSTSVNTSNLETFFFNRRYYQLTLEDADIASVLSRDSLSTNSQLRTIEIIFSPIAGDRPLLTLNLNGSPYAEYVLQRANSGPGTEFRPEPENRYFLNHADLYDSAKATNEINADVASRSAANPPSRYTYVSMYIAAAGKSYDMPPRNIYSQPTFIGVFMLPESF